MKTFDEYTQNIRAKAKNIKKRRRIALSCTAVFVLALALTLFVPYSDQLPSVDRYSNSPYYKLIPGLNKATYQPPAYKNNYEWLKDALSFTRLAPTDDAPGNAFPTVSGDVFTSLGDAPDYSINAVPEGNDALNNGQTYQEVTDNQVQGVTESDIFKRSDKYIYYLRGNQLSVYTIDKENSAEIATVELPKDSTVFSWNFEMFLSQDCTTLTVLSQQSIEEMGACTVLYSLDVSDPTDIRLQEPVYFPGSYITARVVEDDLLLIYNYRVTGEIDFDKPETFVPVYGTREEQQPIAAEDIYCPVEDPTDARYTVIAKLDAKTLQVEDTAALLSYSDEVYVSQSAVYATYGCARSEKKGDITVQTALTEITGIGYTGEKLDVLGTVTLEGSVKDQYSIDEYNGILRVAASTSVLTRQEQGNGDYSWVSTIGRAYNCSLYCIDLSTWEVAASVLAFAPDGEEVTAARFDGPTGYVCTAEVIIMTDPVYFFDLSDIHNITYKHTPVIDGYSSSLINFGDYLLGIGQADWATMKLEVYEETADGVQSVTAYERKCVFSEEYKSYFIDRENWLIGLHVADSDSSGNCPYLLLHFDGYTFYEVKVILSDKTDCALGKTRAFLDDGWLYILTEESDGFIVEQLA